MLVDTFSKLYKNATFKYFYLLIVVNFANSLLCGVIYAQLPRQVKVDMKSLFNTSIQIDKMTHK